MNKPVLFKITKKSWIRNNFL